ncbi:CRP/FNR family cyclic AMP-dependent transcriptional regulator [Mobilisporobacter senegalensis]|uniref:CRP/FNR family cyclic AMP-dependent transcriptional regulator n=1 Tax=Mobilisporobacter senegalensis TaxID=1329262 RepID=A0A3N1XP70_9FIRM|nr:Crp/Fnr family transcriptional regulator [Mobilisporobacter senegalensis]ROR28445.1 CRP/FNR family cyclic AMP-dependent transcriptional regulator [Mobilisporobacter senegalensis]
MDNIENDNVYNFLNELHGTAKDYLNKYLSQAPDWLLDSIQIVKTKKNTTFIRENEKVDFVYILAEGIVKAIDYRFLGNSYDYMWFYPVKTFGGMEILLELDHFQTTLSTMTSCKMLVIPKNIFEKWMKSDINALSMEVKTMGSFLLEEVKRERVFLFIQGSDRVIYILTHLYEQTAIDNVCIIKVTHQDLADSTGLSIKTINRSLKKLEEEAYISRSGNKIIIKETQYKKMKEIVDQNHGN